MDAIARALDEVGDPAGGLLWRAVCRELAGPLRIGLVARDAGSARRAIARLPAVPGGSWVAIGLTGEEHPAVGLGAQDLLLGVHALLVATPFGAALGASEREALAALDAAGAPARRALTVADAHLVDRLSDDPIAEAEAVYARLDALLPDGWPLVRPDAVGDWVERLVAGAPELVPARRDEVARVLLREAIARTERAIADEERARGEIDALLSRESAALDDGLRAARRVAAHTVAIVRRRTAALDLELQAFLRDLEAGLPAEVAAVEPDIARRTLPHWLTHVVEAWMRDRLATWRRAVLEELAELELDEVVHAELLVPALQPASVHGETRWARRLGSTAAFGGAAALLAFGLWVPGLVALASGVVWSTFQRGESEAGTRERLVATARAAIRQMGADAHRVLDDQVQQLTDELHRLTDERTAAERDGRAPELASLAARRAERERAIAERSAARAKLVALLEVPAA